MQLGNRILLTSNRDGHMTDIRDELRKHRKLYGFTLYAQAKALGLSHSMTLRNIENEKSTNPYKAEELRWRMQQHMDAHPLKTETVAQ